MADNNAGDTLEFLRILGPGPADDAGAAPHRASTDLPEVTFSDLTPVKPDASGAPAPSVVASIPEEPKPVVIKGGPRRVVRADGRQPEMSYAMGQNRFALSSGHRMFVPKKRRNLVRETLCALLALALVACVFAVAWRVGQNAITLDEQRDVVGTSAYDGALSLTPAKDGGYYTAFLVTSTPADEQAIGTLSQVVLYRCDKDVTQAVRVLVPANLYVAASGSSSEARTLAQLLGETQSVTRTLQGIDKALGTRIYNVVCCGQDAFDELSAVVAGERDASSVDPASLLGRVRTNLTLEDLVAYCGAVGAIGRSDVAELTVPTTDLDVNGTVMAQCTADAYAAALNTLLNTPANVKYDENGYYAGTQYDEWGNPLLDETGAPQGALRDGNGNLIFDENGYLQFYGQQYDANGWPVGTQYDDWGNPLLDQWGNPLGSQYNEQGDFERDWRGNIVIVAQ